MTVTSIKRPTVAQLEEKLELARALYREMHDEIMALRAEVAALSERLSVNDVV